MTQVSCNLCGSSRSELFREASDPLTNKVFCMVCCIECGLIYVNPRPSAQDIPNYYPQKHQSSAPAVYERMDARPRIKIVSKLSRGKSGVILDVGCGKGLLLAGLKKLGWEVYGTELSETSSRYAREVGLIVHNSYLEACQFNPESFDVITFFHSLEHMLNPLETLQFARTLLKPQGFLVVEVPNVGSWYARAFGQNWFHLDVPRHLYHFGPDTLSKVLTRAGFRVLRKSTLNLQYDAFGGVQSLLNLSLKRKNLLNDFNTGQVTIGDIRRAPQPLRNLVGLGLSELVLMTAMPIFLFLAVVSSPWGQGGVLRFVAQRAS